ncbi:MAG: S53 family peptidase [Betaproteobacteria bacterium]
MNFHRTTAARPAALSLLATLLAGSLAACGGGNEATASVALQDTASAVSVAPEASAAEASVDLSQVEMKPLFHMAPVDLAEPGDADKGGTNVSASSAPQSFTIAPELADVDTARLTLPMLASRMADVRRHAAAVTSEAATAAVAPSATTSLVGVIFTPAQIRAAYGLPPLPAAGAAISTAVAATLGAGQTIYILDAYHDASALTDLNLFSTKFGLPTCGGFTVATTAALPMSTASASCHLATVYATSTGTMTATAPAYSSGWITESKLDVQWAHAIAPLARIVLIETPNAMTSSFLGAVALAGRMGPGVVSMSFGSAEAGWVATVDSKFTGTGMSYVAASGDIGGQVNWPAVSPNVLAVGGTGLKWTGSGTRYEEAWSKGGGGVSLYEPLPAWQSGLSVTTGALGKRGVADVAFNANPLTAQYTAVTLPGVATKWTPVGGTSIGAPQWAGLIAIANAVRAANGKARLGDIHTSLYKSIGAVAGTYASAFADIVVGNNGTCSNCTTDTGYDTATGLGTPNAAGLLTALSGVAVQAEAVAVNHAPTLAAATVSKPPNMAFSTQLLGKDADGDALTYTMTGAPAGLSLGTRGLLAWWTRPVVGTYNLTVTVKDSHGATGTGAIKLVIS